MTKVTPDLIKALRETTQAPMMDCKKALEENHGDIEKATQWLREKGLAKAAKKLTSIAADGQTRVVVHGDKAVIYEVNCQTDFTAYNDHFVKLVDHIGEALLHGHLKNNEDVSKVKLSSGETIEEACLNLTAKIGEKIVLRRYHIENKTPNDTFGSYIHMGGKISALTKLTHTKDAEAAKNIAMHIAAMNPKFLNSTKVNQEWLANEKKVLLEQTMAEGKPKEFAEKIVLGRVNKLLAENCLVDQQFVKDPTKKVSEYVKALGANIETMNRFELGEGIEKQQSNFAEEVAAQMKEAKKS